MTPTAPHRLFGLTALALAAASPSMAADSSTQLAQRRDQIEKAESDLARWRSQEIVACNDASAALSGFIAFKKADAAALAALAQTAMRTREACARAQTEAASAQAAAAGAWSQLKDALAGSTGSVAVSAGTPVLAPAAPAALFVAIERAAAAPSPSPAPAPLPAAPAAALAAATPAAPAPLPLGVAELIAAAAKAQAQVDKARTAYADPYEAGDTASARVLAEPGLDQKQRNALAADAQKARATAAVVRAAVRSAQDSANKLVQQALELKKCHPTPGCTDTQTQVDASRTYRQMVDSLARAKTEFEAGAEAGLYAAVGVTYKDDADDRARHNAIAFAKLLDTFPDARSALGEESAFGLSAIGSSKLASIKLGGARNLPMGWRQTSFVLSAPLDSTDNAQLYTRGTGFNNAASVSASTYWVLGGSRGSMFAGKTYLTAAGVKASAGLGGKHSYLGDDLKPREADRLLREGSVGGYVSLFRQARDGSGEPVGEPSVHVFAMEARRALELGKKTTRCAALPAPGTSSLACVNGYFTPPTFEYTRQFSYEYRIQRAKWAFAPKVQYEDVTHQTTVRAPLYLIRSGDAGDKKAFNAGVELLWTRGRDDAGQRTTDRALGVFVGLPFSMGEVSRD